MLNNFCFHVYTQKTLIIGENDNDFFYPSLTLDGVRICSLYQTHITLNCPDPDRDSLNTTNMSSFTILNTFTVSNIT